MANECPRGLTDNPEDSKFCMECVLDQDPKCAYSYYFRGNIQFDWDMYVEAIENYEHAIELDPKHADSYYNLGLCQEEIELEHLALENFKKFLNLDSDKTSECVEYAKRVVNKYIK